MTLQWGIDRVVENPHLLAHAGRIGLVTTQSCTTKTFVPTADAIKKSLRHTPGASIFRVFGPQHGYRQTEQDNMIETADARFHFPDGDSVPLISLYSNSVDSLGARLLEDVDTVVLDLQDIGCRVYTYMQTLALCLKAVSGTDKRLIVLDRPNPLGLSAWSPEERRWMRTEGNPLDLRWESLVGWFAIPMRHGLTLGELGRHYIAANRLDVDYDILQVQGLRRSTDLRSLAQEPWTLPSPNIPSWLSAWFFPSFVVLEAANVSEGRGTTKPFQIVGSPWLRAIDCLSFLRERASSTSTGRPNSWQARTHDFRPTFNKHAGVACKGLCFHADPCLNTNLFELGMWFLYFAIAAHPDDFSWTPPGYEYNMTDPRLPLILGSDRWTTIFQQAQRTGVSSNTQASLEGTLLWAESEAQRFAESLQDVHIYPT